MCKIRLKPTCCSCAVISQTHAFRASICRMSWDVRGVWLWVGERAVMLLYDTRIYTCTHARTQTEGMENLARNPRPLSIHHMVGESRPGGIGMCACVRACVRLYSRITSTRLRRGHMTNLPLASAVSSPTFFNYSWPACTHAHIEVTPGPFPDYSLFIWPYSWKEIKITWATKMIVIIMILGLMKEGGRGIEINNLNALYKFFNSFNGIS